MAGQLDRKPGYIAVIPAEVRYDTSLAPNAKLLYGEITALANADGYCWASNDYFAKLYNMDKRTVSRLIGALQERGHIQLEIVRKKGGEGCIEVRKIYIGRKLMNAAKGIDKIVHTPRQNCREGIDKNVQDLNKVELTSNNIPPISPAGMELFERFWAAYPKHKAKAAAKKAWGKLNPSMELCRTMAAALDAQKKSFDWTKENGRYIPYASTWLNGRRWEDEVKVSESDRAPDIPADDERRGRYL